MNYLRLYKIQAKLNLYFITADRGNPQSLSVVYWICNRRRRKDRERERERESERERERQKVIFSDNRLESAHDEDE